MGGDDSSPITDDRHNDPDKTLSEYTNSDRQPSDPETKYEPEQASSITEDDRETVERESQTPEESTGAGEQDTLVADVDDGQQTLEGEDASGQSKY